MAKKWSEEEVFLILDFYSFLSKHDVSQHDGFIRYYFKELQYVVPSFECVKYEDFSRLMNGLTQGSIQLSSFPDLFGEENAKYVKSFNGVLRKTILQYAANVKKKLFITDCEDVALCDIWPTGEETDSLSQFSLKQLTNRICRDEIDQLIAELINHQNSEDCCEQEAYDESVSSNETGDTNQEQNNKSELDRKVESDFWGKDYYRDILFSDKEKKGKQVTLPIIYANTLYLISELIKHDIKRIVIVMPDDVDNLMPMVITQLISDNMESSYDKFDNLVGVEPGQRMRLGKAVIEVVEINEQHFSYKYLNGSVVDPWSDSWYQYLTPVDSDKLSSNKYLDSERNRVVHQARKNAIIQRLVSNRGAAKYTSMLLSTKANSDNWIKNAMVSGIEVKKLIVKGHVSNINGRIEADESEKLLPNYVVVTSMQQALGAFRNENQINRVYVSSDKVGELLANQMSFENLLKRDVPVIVFLSDMQYENFKELERYAFTLYHWKPSTLSASSVMPECDEYQGTMFESIAFKTRNASVAEFELFLCKNITLTTFYNRLSHLTKVSKDYDMSFRNMIHKFWLLFRCFVSSCHSTEMSSICSLMTNDVSAVREHWSEMKHFYALETVDKVEELLLWASELASETSSEKSQRLYELIESCDKEEKSIAVITPDNYVYSDILSDCLIDKYGDKKDISVYRLRDFISEKSESFRTFDIVVSVWFDKKHYLEIKDTYAYKKLVFILYDFEERWRQSFKDQYNDSLKHEKSKLTLKKIGIENTQVKEKPFDDVQNQLSPDTISASEATVDYDNVVNMLYNHSNEVVSHAEETVGCSTVVTKDYIICYLPDHKVWEISNLISNGENVNSKYTRDLKTGDCFVVRNSSKDIVAETADGFIGKRASELRKVASAWVYCLNELINENGFDSVFELLQKEKLCTRQQLRYWSLGEIICPDNPKVLEKLALLCTGYKDEVMTWFSKNYNEVFVKGKELQKFHLLAGKILSRRLKDRSKELKAIYRAGGTGYLAGIGKILVLEVEEVLNNQTVIKSKLNKLEAI